MSRLSATVTAALAALLAVGTAQAEFTLEPCTLSGSTGLGSVEARCGWLDRPEDPDDPDSRTISLRVAVIPSLSPDPLPDAFTVINGGPGGSSLEMYADSAGVFTPVLRERDIVVMDQRGTGASHPLDCPELEAMNLEFSAELIETSTRLCLEALDADPRFYTTSVAVRDLEALREALGYERLNVYGVSYGTRVAQHYARRYPTSIRTLVIDSVTPPDIPLGPNAALNAQRTLDRLIDRCAEDVACAEAFPRLEEDLTALANRLLTAPIAMEIPDPVSGRPEPVDLSHGHLVLTVRLLSYASETASLLPVIIDEAQNRGNFVPLATNAIRIESQLLGAIRLGMHNSVVCAEDIPFLNPSDFEGLDDTYMGSEQVKALETICHQWPKGITDDDLREPLTTDVPTLVLSGAEDPITPPDYGERVSARLPNSVHLVGAGQGHGMLSRGCVPRLIGEFVSHADPSRLDGSCVDRLRPSPFFLTLLGPAP
jgi:pimeloyl-ACP methyl ester carboxylesterase